MWTGGALHHGPDASRQRWGVYGLNPKSQNPNPKKTDYAPQRHRDSEEKFFLCVSESLWLVTVNDVADLGFGIWDLLCPQLISLRRLRAKQVANEVVPASTNHVRLSGIAVTAVRQQEQIKIFVRLDQFVDEHERARRRHVVVHCAVGQQQLTLQVFREILIRLAVIVRRAVWLFDEQTLPLLRPVVFIVPVVVVAGFRDANLEEIRIVEHRAGRRIAAT